MEYEIKVYPIYLDDGKIEWCAEFPDLVGCVGGGNTLQEAIEDAQISKEIYLEYLEENNMDIPIPTIQKFDLPSGRISLRVAKSTHKKLLELADSDGVSLNSYINSAINEKIGQSNVFNCVNGLLDSMQQIMIGAFNPVLKSILYRSNELKYHKESNEAKVDSEIKVKISSNSEGFVA